MEFIGLNWAQWMQTGASATSALAFCPDRKIQPRSPLATARDVPQVVSDMVACIVSTATVRRRKKLRRSATEPLAIMAHKSRYGIRQEDYSRPIPSRVVNISRWYSCQCKDPDIATDVCPVEDSMRDMSINACDISSHSPACVRSAAAHFGVEPIIQLSGALDVDKTARQIAKMEYVSSLRE